MMKGAVWLNFSLGLPRLPRVRRPADSSGALSVPLLMLLLAVSLMGIGTLGVMRSWRHQTELQIRLDRCVGEEALELKAVLERIEGSNRRMRALRAAGGATILVGGSNAVRAPLQAEALYQDLEQLRWRARQAAWLVRRGCGGPKDLPAPLPGMSWLRPPPDVLGPQPLIWSPGAPRALKIGIFHAPRAAATQVAGSPGIESGGMYGSSWKASWIPPGILPGLYPRPGVD